MVTVLKSSNSQPKGRLKPQLTFEHEPTEPPGGLPVLRNQPTAVKFISQKTRASNVLYSNQYR